MITTIFILVCIFCFVMGYIFGRTNGKHSVLCNNANVKSVEKQKS